MNKIAWFCLIWSSALSVLMSISFAANAKENILSHNKSIRDVNDNKGEGKRNENQPKNHEDDDKVNTVDPRRFKPFFPELFLEGELGFPIEDSSLIEIPGESIARFQIPSAKLKLNPKTLKSISSLIPSSTNYNLQQFWANADGSWAPISTYRYILNNGKQICITTNLLDLKAQTFKYEFSFFLVPKSGDKDDQKLVGTTIPRLGESSSFSVAATYSNSKDAEIKYERLGGFVKLRNGIEAATFEDHTSPATDLIPNRIVFLISKQYYITVASDLSLDDLAEIVSASLVLR